MHCIFLPPITSGINLLFIVTWSNSGDVCTNASAMAESGQRLQLPEGVSQQDVDDGRNSRASEGTNLSRNSSSEASTDRSTPASTPSTSEPLKKFDASVAVQRAKTSTSTCPYLHGSVGVGGYEILDSGVVGPLSRAFF
jgi:hypothetical protein